MKWYQHLVVAAIVGVLVVILLEIYFGVSASTTVIEFFANYGVGLTLLVAALIILALALWWWTSRG